MRYKPYVQIARAKCLHCGARAAEEWSFKPCAVGRRVYIAVCLPCDMKINRLVLELTRYPNADRLFERYYNRKVAKQQ